MTRDGQELFRADLFREGFDEVRFAPAAAVPQVHAQRFSQWLDRGGHADMAWMERTRDKRVDPGRVLSGVRSIVVLGVNYWPDREVARRQKTWAKYALYRDYHDTMEKALKRAGAFLEQRFGAASSDYRYYVDTGPVMERGLAARCGLGFQGKNGMLISRTHGNWLFLACILTRLDFVPDPPLKGGNPIAAAEGVGRFCGTCRRCIDACPTDAITEPGMVDAPLCISYQTIENKDVIPRELRPSIGERLFGCDICLDVCPWNRFARTGRQWILEQRYHFAELTLIDLLTMTPETFSEVFRQTPIKRLKWRGLMRNACVVAGNVCRDREEGAEKESVLDALVALAGSGEWLVRAHAVWAVYRIAHGRARDRLRACRRRESEPRVLREYAWAEEAGDS